MSTVTFENVCRAQTKRQVIIKMNKFNMFITAVCVVSILVSEWIITALWSDLWFWSVTVSVIFGAVSLISCCLVGLSCYFAIRRGIRGHDTQIQQQQNHGRTAIANNFDLQHYRETLRNMMWISGFLIARYIPSLLALFAILILGLTHSTLFAAVESISIFRKLTVRDRETQPSLQRIGALE